MPFTDEDKHFINIMRKEKRYSSHKFIPEFPNKNWSRHGLNHLVKLNMLLPDIRSDSFFNKMWHMLQRVMS